MADTACSLYNACVGLMGPVKHKLLCLCNVDQSWWRKVQSQLKYNEKKTYMYKSLKILQHEIDVTFKELLNTYIFLEELEKDTDTKQFKKKLFKSSRAGLLLQTGFGL